jgi:hypothetical protein
VSTPGPADEEQEEQKEEEPAAEEEEEEGEEGEAEEGGEGAEGEAEAAAPPLQREPSESSIPRPVFPLKHHITVTLAELPKEVREGVGQAWARPAGCWQVPCRAAVACACNLRNHACQ